MLGRKQVEVEKHGVDYGEAESPREPKAYSAVKRRRQVESGSRPWKLLWQASTQHSAGCVLIS